MLKSLFSKRLDDNQMIIAKDNWVNAQGQLNALTRSQAIIEFDMSGNVLFANDNFLNALGYSLEEVQGKHHSIFVDNKYRNSRDYKEFWTKLNNGEFQSGEFCRYSKDGEAVWIEASYNPIFDANNKPFKVVKFATDITEKKKQNSDYESQLDAISKSQAVISFELDGTILSANDNFLNALGYTLGEVEGKHHSLFVDSEYKKSEEYRNFWRSLANGEHFIGRYPRIHKNGKIVWIQANYSPIRDPSGTPYKVVKFATDITAEVEAEQQLQLTVSQVNAAIDAAVNNDLTQRVETEDKSDMMLSISQGVNSLLDTMTEIIINIKNASDAVYTGAREISNGNTDLSNRTEQQASSLEETASSMEELTGTVRQNADSAKQANTLASNAVTVAIDGGHLIEDVVKTMASINESSQKIADIIGMIDGIAFQTNILALNAAVEAARAGEQGRGFAVVASEVRTLAQRSANAAKDIKDLISESATKINNGNDLVNKSGNTMREVVSAIKQVNDIMAEIASASAEQSSGLDEIGKAVSQMDEMTQQNAALVEEAAAASESLLGQADQLTMNVNKFILNDDNQSQNIKQIAHTTKSTPSRPSAVKKLPSASAPVKKAKPLPKPQIDDEDDGWEEF
ncbi:methyl-accepting chemotaxis sensory transducer with Pas/Pac sensor [Marinomonas polaris DSM 16579]|uniref:Methyl-accepting chemotaxis sensory transducer with Pas/Pac sensor n=1 Tax=Marinomonas polaris DSM 16579 TaxID=1122206 RepID=A0A1M5I9E5_9GAMM|nr:methyl-accepting chemotaxis protein [Marinomonas polaris]SHG25018.1 methyl-accepting chemotaxis sensory transducer with Pas/Pac sensor [Marinomonas polaris DSM 16579]